MTVTDAPVRRRAPSAGHPSPRAAWRLLYLELRRNPMPWMVPLLAALFVFDPYRTAMSYPPLWDLRASVVVNKLLPDFVVFVAGVSAWMGSRDHRRRTTDLVTATPRPRWAAQVATWAATTCWTIVAFLSAVAVLYGVTASQATWGSPLWWPVVTGCAELAAICALAFAVGAFFPGRFTAPLTAIGAFLLSLEGFRNAVGHSSVYALLSPTTVVPPGDIGLFYHYLPDVALAQLMFLAGLTVAGLGALGLSRTADGGLRLRRAAAIVAVAGLAATGTAVGLVGTARDGTAGMVIPALHDAANDRLITFTPLCRQATVPVCVHPGYRPSVDDVTAAFSPVLREVAGLPGAPARVTEIGQANLANATGTISGTPPVLHFAMPSTPGSFGETNAAFAANLQIDLVTAFIVGGGSPGAGPQTVHKHPTGQAVQQQQAGQAVQAVQLGLLAAAGLRVPAQPQELYSYGWPESPPSPQAYAAARRFAALPAASRHAWLLTHLAALRAGHITPAQLP